MEALEELRPWRAILALLTDWMVIVGCFVTAARFPSVPVFVVAAVLIARTQLALAVLMHDSAHGVMFRSRRLNDVVGQVFTAAPLALSLFVYRHGHLKHHRDPMAPDDPVAIVFRINDYPIPPRALFMRLLRDLLGIGYVQTVVQLARGAGQDAVKKPGHLLLVSSSIVMTQALLLSGLFTLGHPEFYLTLWFLPAVTILQVFGRIRAIMEHAGYPNGDDQSKTARTVIHPTWQTFFVGPHAIHFHIEHHLDVRVPFYNLAAAHKLMAAQGNLPEANLYRGYGQVLRDVTRT